MSKKVVFLYLYGLHQLYHNAMTSMELGNLNNDTDVLCLSCNEEHTKTLEKIKKHYPHTKTKIIELNQPFRYKYLNFKKKTYPSVNAMIKRAKKYLQDTDLVLTTSHGTPGMFRKFDIDRTQIMYQYHGVGDRKYGFDPNFKKFDFMLLPGRYHQDRLVNEKIIDRKNTKIVGWPKLDYINQLENPHLFDNENPTVLYAPHWVVELTSYNIYAEFILDYFRQRKDINLIFAPHLLIKHWRYAYKYNIEYCHYNSENIRVDFGSEYSNNGTYLKYADIYMGDVSSMVFEFIAIKPRPCVFLNAHHVKWQGNIDYRFWDMGKVVEQFDEFDQKLNNSMNNYSFKDLQIERLHTYIDLTNERSSKRAAQAIQEFL
jgi:hypothetical protein